MAKLKREERPSLEMESIDLSSKLSPKYGAIPRFFDEDAKCQNDLTS